MSIHPYTFEQLAVLRQRELIEHAARIRQMPRKRSRLQQLVRAAWRSFARSSAPARPSVVVPTIARRADATVLD